MTHPKILRARQVSSKIFFFSARETGSKDLVGEAHRKEP